LENDESKNESSACMCALWLYISNQTGARV
jgi:hypothetical protein